MVWDKIIKNFSFDPQRNAIIKEDNDFMSDLHDNWEEPGNIEIEIENPTQCVIDFGEFDFARQLNRRTLGEDNSLAQSMMLVPLEFHSLLRHKFVQ